MTTSAANESPIKPPRPVPLNAIGHRCRETTKTFSRPALLHLTAAVFTTGGGDLRDEGSGFLFAVWTVEELLNKDRLRRSCTTQPALLLVSWEKNILDTYIAEKP